MLRSVKFPVEIRLVELGLLCTLTTGSTSARVGEGVSAGAVIREMNLARQNPALYATYVEELRARYDGGLSVFPGGTKWRMKEGLTAIDEAVRFLRAAAAERSLTLSPGMCRAAAKALLVIALADMEFRLDSGVKTSRMEKAPRARSFLRSLSTMATRLGHIAETFSILVSTMPALPPGRMHGMAGFARLISPLASLNGAKHPLILPPQEIVKLSNFLEWR